MSAINAISKGRSQACSSPLSFIQLIHPVFSESCNNSVTNSYSVLNLYSTQLWNLMHLSSHRTYHDSVQLGLDCRFSVHSTGYLRKEKKGKEIKKEKGRTSWPLVVVMLTS